jgi:hypothetical protein
MISNKLLGSQFQWFFQGRSRFIASSAPVCPRIIELRAQHISPVRAALDDLVSRAKRDGKSVDGPNEPQ